MSSSVSRYWHRIADHVYNTSVWLLAISSPLPFIGMISVHRCGCPIYAAHWVILCYFLHLFWWPRCSLELISTKEAPTKCIKVHEVQSPSQDGTMSTLPSFLCLGSPQSLFTGISLVGSFLLNLLPLWHVTVWDGCLPATAKSLWRKKWLHSAYIVISCRWILKGSAGKQEHQLLVHVKWYADSRCKWWDLIKAYWDYPRVQGTPEFY